ncbi:MAG: sulfatase [Planctomycetes bacterium]|nr:sulfatase [Planctomycetota bacterium]
MAHHSNRITCLRWISILRFARWTALSICLITPLIWCGCPQNIPGSRDVAPDATHVDGSLLFKDFSLPGTEASFGLVSFHLSLTTQWKSVAIRGSEELFAHDLGFFPDNDGVGLLTLQGKPIPRGLLTAKSDSQESWWAFTPSTPQTLLDHNDKPIKLAVAEESSSRTVPLEGSPSVTEPVLRLIHLKVRGVRSHNRYPVLQVFLNEDPLFEQAIPHDKPRDYWIPFMQPGRESALRFVVGATEASIPVLADQSTAETQLQVDALEIQKPPRLLLHPPTGAGISWVEQAATGFFTWTEFPSRTYAPAEQDLLKDADRAQTLYYLEAKALQGEKLGRVTRPGFPIRVPANFAFPVSFVSPSRLTFSVGLTPTYRNHLFIQVSARDEGSGRLRTLYEKAITQPLLEPEETWHNLSVDLPADLKGKGVLEFHFLSHPGSAEISAPESAAKNPAAHGYFSSPRLLPRRGKADTGKPNVLLISIDTLRADHLSCYGYPLETSPHLDRFAEQALVFTQAISTSSWTLPSHIALLGGAPLGALGTLFKDRRMDSHIPTMAEQFQKAGFRTAAFVGGGYVSADFGMNRGFDCFDERSLDVESGYGRVADWLEENKDGGPFFLFFHFFDVHAPYGDKTDDPEKFFRETGCPIDPGLVKEIQEGIYTRENTCGSFQVHISDMARRHMINLYDADILHVDGWMERLFTLLRATGLFEETAIIITSDHGEEFGEHGNWHHSKHLYREVVQVPLILKLPGRNPAQGRVDVPVSLLDIAPTLTSLAGLPSAPQWHGDSLLEIAQDSKAFLSRKVLSENVIPHGDRSVHMIALQDHLVKYFRVFCEADKAYPDGVRGFNQGERQEIYQLLPDPMEQVDVADFYPRLREGLRKETLDRMQELKKEHSARTGTTPSEISREVMEQLEALGYMK